MKVTVTTLTDVIFNLDVHEDLELENFKAFCEVESGVPVQEIIIVLNGRPLIGDKKSLKAHGLIDGDVVIMQQHRQNQAPAAAVPGTNPSSLGFGFGVPAVANATPIPQFDFSTIQVPKAASSKSRPQNHNSAGEDDPAAIRDQILASPEQLALLKQNNPQLADALQNDFGKFSSMIREMQRLHREKEAQRIRLLTADSFDVEAQKLIDQEIRQKNIDANMEAAMEFNPESFGTVCMLYIECKVNGFPVKAFVDSGAQTTIMSTECAERCNIMRLVDTRFSGIAKGVGTQRIIGRIHMVQIQINGDFLTSSFSILEDQKMDMLLGLDMLRRHQCVIDLQKNVLRIGTTNTESRFLSEAELPESARLTSASVEKLMQHEKNLQALENEDLELAQAVEASVRDQAKAKSKDTTSAGSGARGHSHSPSSSASAAGSGTPEPSEVLIQEIVSMGFARESVIFELIRFNGDKTQAIAALIAKSLKF